ncbi:MAG: hypothetical protein M3347_07545, partial [Armatimonadota bacterium]|nr:hypothetical protein [Armatimonadota bacterium]
MSLHFEDLFALAQRLDAQARQLTSSNDAGLHEAMLRAAISRSYYAVFWCGRRYFETAQPPQRLPRFGAHIELYTLFANYPAETMKAIARGLEQLRWLRNQADYQPVMSDLETKTTNALQLAN